MNSQKDRKDTIEISEDLCNGKKDIDEQLVKIERYRKCLYIRDVISNFGELSLVRIKILIKVIIDVFMIQNTQLSKNIDTIFRNIKRLFSY